MDYQRIYREFIADRKAKEEPQGYAELHHIIPKSHGGPNTRENLILLTAEDHFFAHLLLAKIHGAGMWTAVCRMRWGKVGGERTWIRGRYLYAVARRRLAIDNSARFTGQPGKRGSENGRYDEVKLLWTNVDTGTQVLATKWEMWSRFGGSRAHWTSAAIGSRKSMLGWTPNVAGMRVRSAKGKTFRFVNRDGRTFVGTQGDFVRHAGLTVASGTRVAKYSSVSRCGWRLEGTADRPHNAPRVGKKLGAPGKNYTLEKNGIRVTGNRAELAKVLGSTPAQVSAGIFALREKGMTSYKGWSLCPA